MRSAAHLSVIVSAVRQEARNILGLDLRLPAGAPLPAFTAGAHIDLHLGNGLVRSYSLLSNPADLTRYSIAILNDMLGRGGSRYVHESLSVGTTLTISIPRNHFPLNEAASKTVLVAGGIGVTPILSMLRRLDSIKAPRTLLYCARSRDDAAFFDLLADVPGVQVRLDERHGSQPDLMHYLQDESADSDFYCCGPLPMIRAFEAACTALGFSNIHTERFAADNPIEAPRASGYQVTLARSGRVIDVSAHVHLLDALEEAGIAVESACREGICGACETRVLHGVPDHRDSILSTAEKASNKSMLVCVSGCIGQRLVLDL